MRLLILILIVSCASLMQAQNSYQLQKEALTEDIKSDLSLLNGMIGRFSKETVGDTIISTQLVKTIISMSTDVLERISNTSEEITELEYQEEVEKQQPVVEVIPEVETKNQEVKKPKKMKLPLKFRLMSFFRNARYLQSIGANILQIPDNGRSFDQDTWNSDDSEYGIGFHKALGKSQKVKFFFGIIYHSKNIALKNIDIINAKNKDGYEIIDSDIYDRLVLGAKYVKIPLGFRISTSKKTDFYIGGSVGIRYNSYVEKNYDKYYDEEVSALHTASYGLDRFNYGVDASFGMKFFKVFAKYELSPTLSKGYNMMTLGVRTY